jgi:hypothetical protein
MTFESGSIGSPDPGSIWYEDNVFNMKLDQADPVLQVGQENWVRVEAGEDISNGDVVYISDSSGGGPNALPVVSLASADRAIVDAALSAGDPNPSEILGIACCYTRHFNWSRRLYHNIWIS